MLKIDSNACYKQLMKMPISNIKIKTRIPKTQDDFGDDQTVGLCLKRRNRCIFSGDPNDSFGLFLGLDDNNKYIVGINELGHKFKFVGGESFDSIEDLKDDWVLD